NSGKSDKERRLIMCDKLEHPRDCGGSGRRNFLKATSAATALGLVRGGLFPGSARGDALTKAQRDQMTPEQIIQVMRKGNERFRKGERRDRNYLREQRASAKGQGVFSFPYTAASFGNEVTGVWVLSESEVREICEGA